MEIQFALLVSWVVCALLMALLAKHRGRSAVGWTFASLALSPLAALPLLLMMKNMNSEENIPANLMRCPHCSELISRDAPKCKFCGALAANQAVEF
ncbi:hypothetical protein [Azohydromonas lata]|uniref:hypothetical protein n=1 Tax=Azohydromonas lata TaxID=45677 RepID=UPI0012F505B8|nr:hypothetical protein [Azohydromonas lata]